MNSHGLRTHSFGNLKTSNGATGSGRLRAVLVVPALLLALVALLRFSGYRQEREALVARVVPLLGAEARAVERLRREPDLEQARVLAARALVRQVLRQKAPLSRADRLERLALSRQLGAEALRRRPASWGASTLLGASTYLGWSIDHDNRLLMAAPAWEGPLWHATVLGPGKAEPASFLSMAYLELWPTLPPNKRQEARNLVRRGLADPESFPRLIGAWMATAEKVEEALELVPAQPYAWRHVRSLLENRADWHGYALATRRWYEVLDADFAAGFEEAAARQAAGDVVGARNRLLLILRETPLDARYAETMTRVMQRLPAGLTDTITARHLKRWLEWALPLCRIGSCPLPPAAIGRLARATESPQAPSAAQLALRAETALLAGNLSQGEELERQASETWQAEWAHYFIAKSYLLIERKSYAEARAALEGIHPSTQNMPDYWRARVAVEQAAGDPTAAAWAEARLETLRADHWPAAAWFRPGTQAQLNLLSSAAEGVEIHLDPPTSRRVSQRPEVLPAVTVSWDGRTLTTQPATPGEPIRLALAVTAGEHLLVLESLGGRAITPGAVRLLDHRPESPRPKPNRTAALD